jgi:BolA protein
MPEGTVERLRARLQALQPQRLVIEDDSARHAGHEGAKSGGGHYRLHLVSRRFEGLPRLARHRLVYDSLAEMMQREVHALTMLLQTPDEAGACPPPHSGK